MKYDANGLLPNEALRLSLCSRMNLAMQTAAVEQQIRETMEKRAEQLEKLAAAFIAEVGAREASQFQLVEQSRMTPDGYVTTWHFERRTAE